MIYVIECEDTILKFNLFSEAQKYVLKHKNKNYVIKQYPNNKRHFNKLAKN